MITKKMMMIVVLLIVCLFLGFLKLAQESNPKEVNNLDFNQNYAYTLAKTDGDKTKSIVVQFAGDKAEEYIKLEKNYENILMYKNGVVLINGTTGIVYANNNGELKEDHVVEIPAGLISSELVVNDALSLSKTIKTSKLDQDEIKALGDIRSDILFMFNYNFAYEDAFMIDEENYIPRDFDQLSLH